MFRKAKSVSLCLLVAALLLGSIGTRVWAQDDAWYGEYFNNPYLRGTPAFVRYDREIDFEFGYGSPGAGVGVDYFSVRWTRHVYFSETGTYEFGARTDDGVRLWVDGHRIINEWGSRQGQWALGQIFLTEGVHLVRMTYHEDKGWAKAHLGWRLLTSASKWHGEYYNNRDLSGAPVLTRDDDRIAFEWEDGSPDPALPADNFSVRWRRSAYFNAGTYLFRAHTDDGVRVWFNGSLIIDKWQEQERTTYDSTLVLQSGWYDIRVEYFEGTHMAAAHIWWEAIHVEDPGSTVEDPGGGAIAPDEPGGVDPPPIAEWWGEYFDNPDLAGVPVSTHFDGQINFNWGQAAPAHGMPENGFSVRWTQDVNLTRGTWRFYARVDDGIRIWVNNRIVIDKWLETDVTLYTGDVSIWRDGEVPVVVEYFEGVGDAQVQVWFERISS